MVGGDGSSDAMSSNQNTSDRGAPHKENIKAMQKRGEIAC